MPTFRLLTSHGTELCTAPALPAFHSQPAAAHGPLLLDVEPGGRDGVVNAGIGVLIRGPIEPKRVRSIRIEPVGTGEVSLRDTETGYYLCAAPPSQGWGDLALCAPTVGEWERFRLEDAGIDPLQGAFATNTARVGTPLPASAGPSCVPSGLDAIGLAAQPWSIERAANLLLMRSIRPTRRAAVVASFRNEGACILEWLAHARAVGFAHAFIYTNGNTDGSDGLLEALHHAGSLTLLRNEVSASVSPQVKAYEHSIHLLPALRDFEWVAYLDADELLVPDARHDHSVVALIDAVDAQWTAERPAAICVNWHWYGSGGQVFRSDGLLQERFIHARPHSYVKSIVRLRDISTMAGIHIPDPGAVLCVSSGGERLPINQADAGRGGFQGRQAQPLLPSILRGVRGEARARPGRIGRRRRREGVPDVLRMGRAVPAGPRGADPARVAAAGEAGTGTAAAGTRRRRCGGSDPRMPQAPGPAPATSGDVAGSGTICRARRVRADPAHARGGLRLSAIRAA